MDFNSRPVLRVVFEGCGNYRVMDTENRVFQASCSGQMRNQMRDQELPLPTVGDWVAGSFQPGNWFFIEGICERESVLARRDPNGHAEQILAANVETLFIVTSANQDMNLNRLDRYVTLALSGRVQPVVVVNKMELVGDPHALLDEIAARFPAIDIHGISVHEGWNLEALENYLGQGKTVALVGSSGVGKSSLTNRILGGESITVQAIREDDGRGRHTTTHRELHLTPRGAFVIDTPGIRQVGLVDGGELASSFADIEALANQCKFGDCRHETEPKCAVRAALGSGQLSEERWQSFRKLERELAFAKRKTDKALQSQEKARWAKIKVAHREREKWRRR